jgi:hypothetical protein
MVSCANVELGRCKIGIDNKLRRKSGLLTLMRKAHPGATVTSKVLQQFQGLVAPRTASAVREGGYIPRQRNVYYDYIEERPTRMDANNRRERLIVANFSLPVFGS